MKIRYFISITSLDTEELIKTFIYTIYKLHGTPSIIIFNKGSLFLYKDFMFNIT